MLSNVEEHDLVVGLHVSHLLLVLAFVFVLAVELKLLEVVAVFLVVDDLDEIVEFVMLVPVLSLVLVVVDLLV